MNPTDAARKQARKKEIARNKMERDLQRATPKDVSEISKRLEDLIGEEESEKEHGRPLSKQLHIRRKVLQDAMKLAVAKERVWLCAFTCAQHMVPVFRTATVDLNPSSAELRSHMFTNLASACYIHYMSMACSAQSKERAVYMCSTVCCASCGCASCGILLYFRDR